MSTDQEISLHLNLFVRKLNAGLIERCNVNGTRFVVQIHLQKQRFSLTDCSNNQKAVKVEVIFLWIKHI